MWDDRPATQALRGLDVWRRLPEWAERAPEPPPGDQPVAPAEARARLAALLGPDAESRPQQADYASAVTPAFDPRAVPDSPNLVLAEAGTGVGKTLGYVAPASVWAEKNGGAVWISTFTRNLQHQIDQELDRLFPLPEDKRRKVVMRKGRENYLCLLNLEEAVEAAKVGARDAIGLGLIARWAGRTKDGALVGSDLPGWLFDVLGRAETQSLSDHRGECIYSACRHYDRCFIERSIRRARRAQIVVANHALVMVQAALAAHDPARDSATLPTRYVFDEGHHLFGAADSAFSAHLTGRETAELRRWVRGADRSGGRRRSRARGLRARVADLVLDDADAEAALEAALRAAAALPGDGWRQRLTDIQPTGVAEAFLSLLREQVYARAPGRDDGYGLEAGVSPPVDGLLAAAAALDDALEALYGPLRDLYRCLAARLDDETDALEPSERQRIESICRSLQRRGLIQIGAWRDMLGVLEADTPAEFVDWFSVDREFGRDVDVGMHRHWLDPTMPFGEHVLKPAHGVVVTSATLRDTPLRSREPSDQASDEAAEGAAEFGWRTAEARVGASHLPAPPIRAAVDSPFDYAEQTRVFVVTDVRRDAPDQVAAAYRELFLAAGGGSLGLFTAISRLRAVYERIAAPLDAAGLPVLAQHIDGHDVSTLIDIFRAQRDTCLLGTDAVRDGIDVPGESLRLIVFDRVPWPRPDILHRARRQHFGRGGYDDLLTRLRLKQAYGRLIRRGGDRGVFVLLDGRLPSRLAGAFPDGLEIARVGIAEAVRESALFLASSGDPTRARESGLDAAPPNG